MTTFRLLRASRLAALAGAAALVVPTSAPAQQPRALRFRVRAGLGAGLLVGEEGSDFLDGGVSRGSARSVAGKRRGRSGCTPG